MLEQITQQVTGVPSAMSLADSSTPTVSSAIDESPASPPMFQSESVEVDGADARVIPVVCPWRLLVVDVPEDTTSFDLKFIQTIQHSLNADPRLVIISPFFVA